MSDIVVRHVQGDRFAVQIRHHNLDVDQPKEMGGEDTGPTPTELFVAGLASCVGFYGERFLKRHELSTDGLTVTCEFSLSEDRPSRVATVDMHVSLPEGFPEARREALLRVLEHCTVHNSIRQPPDVWIRLSDRGAGEPPADPAGGSGS